MAKIKDFRLKIQDARKDKQEAIKEFGEDSFQVHQVDQELFDLMWYVWPVHKRPPFYVLPELDHIIHSKEKNNAIQTDL